MLSGGLSILIMYAEAIEPHGKAPMVDVSSGVESAPGEKDAELIRQIHCRKGEIGGATG